MIQNGYWVVGRWHGAPVRLHWSIPLGAAFFSRFAFVPGAWVGFLVLVLVHEFGHAWVVRRVGGRPTAIEVNGLGGLCHWQGDVDPVQRSLIAWGGVFAQALLFGTTLLSRAIFGAPKTEFGAQFEYSLTLSNLFLIAINLLPFKPLDGSEAWPLFGLLWRRWRRQVKKRRLTLAHSATVEELQRLRAREELERDMPPEAKAVVTKLFDDMRKGPPN